MEKRGHKTLRHRLERRKGTFFVFPVLLFKKLLSEKAPGFCGFTVTTESGLEQVKSCRIVKGLHSTVFRLR